MNHRVCPNCGGRNGVGRTACWDCCKPQKSFTSEIRGLLRLTEIAQCARNKEKENG